METTEFKRITKRNRTMKEQFKRPMRQIGVMIKKFFAPKNKQYWICFPAKMETLEDKEFFIMDTIEFLNNMIEVKEKTETKMFFHTEVTK